MLHGPYHSPIAADVARDRMRRSGIRCEVSQEPGGYYIEWYPELVSRDGSRSSQRKRKKERKSRV